MRRLRPELAGARICFSLPVFVLSTQNLRTCRRALSNGARGFHKFKEGIDSAAQLLLAKVFEKITRRQPGKRPSAWMWPIDTASAPSIRVVDGRMEKMISSMDGFTCTSFCAVWSASIPRSRRSTKTVLIRGRYSLCPDEWAHVRDRDFCIARRRRCQEKVEFAYY